MLDANDAAGAEVSDRRIDDRLCSRGGGRFAQAKSCIPAPIANMPGISAGREPVGLRSASRISAAAMRLGSRPPYAQIYVGTSRTARMSYGPRSDTITMLFSF